MDSFRAVSELIQKHLPAALDDKIWLKWILEFVFPRSARRSRRRGRATIPFPECPGLRGQLGRRSRWKAPAGAAPGAASVIRPGRGY